MYSRYMTTKTNLEFTANDVPSQHGRRILITGGNSGIGYEAALELARHGAEVIRVVFAEVPPRVEYTITELALEMLELVHPLWRWAATNVAKFQVAQTEYDSKHKTAA
jgi:NAD(P)-dependent dehydrogenase (short-subunit alcohol dehydrogenase family)